MDTSQYLIWKLLVASGYYSQVYGEWKCRKVQGLLVARGFTQSIRIDYYTYLIGCESRHVSSTTRYKKMHSCMKILNKKYIWRGLGSSENNPFLRECEKR